MGADFADGHHLLPFAAERFSLKLWDKALEKHMQGRAGKPGCANARASRSAYPKCRSTKPVPEEMKEKLKTLLPTPAKKTVPAVEVVPGAPRP
jgi:hypothetical protein